MPRTVMPEDVVRLQAAMRDPKHRLNVCENALVLLAIVRDSLRTNGVKQGAQAVARAMKSVDGARRHAQGRVIREEHRVSTND